VNQLEIAGFREGFQGVRQSLDYIVSFANRREHPEHDPSSNYAMSFLRKNVAQQSFRGSRRNIRRSTPSRAGPLDDFRSSR